MTTTRVELRIRRLVLDSATGVSRTALCAAVEAELAVLLGLSPGPAHVPVDSGVAALGRHIARAVHRTMTETEGEGES